jgi:hypothetical protein
VIALDHPQEFTLSVRASSHSLSRLVNTITSDWSVYRHEWRELPHPDEQIPVEGVVERRVEGQCFCELACVESGGLQNVVGDEQPVELEP